MTRVDPSSTDPESFQGDGPVTTRGLITSLLRGRARPLTFVGGVVILDALAGLVPPFVVRSVVNHNLVPRSTAGLWLAAVIYVAAVTLQAALTFGYTYGAAVVSQSAIADLRTRVFAHVVALSTPSLDDLPVGDIISRVTSDVETIDQLFTDGVVTLLGQLVPLLAVVGAMLTLSPGLTLVAAVSVPPVFAGARFLQRRVRDAERATRRAIARLNVDMAETLGGRETVLAFARADAFSQRFRRSLDNTLRVQSRSLYYDAFFRPVTGLLSSLVIALVIWVGGASFLSVTVNLGTLTAFILLFQSFFAPLLALGDQWQDVQAAVAGVERVVEVLRIPLEVHPSPVPGDGVGVEMDRVSFAYHDNDPVLRSVSLRVRPGEVVAIIGRSGSGKSTLVSLLAGLLSPDAGEVRVAGVDPRSLDDATRRDVLGVMNQSSAMFAGTLRDNISVFDAAVTDDAIVRALDLVGLRSVVDSAPRGLDSVVAGHGGGELFDLSSGQRQQLALARTLVTMPRVLVFDEATSSLDASSDAAFRRALRVASLDRRSAVVMVAHRLSTARDADRVVVLEHGAIVEEGSPEDLAARPSRFAAWLELEAAGWEWDDVSR
ncbi:MAG: ABC transporter ATP-binding protein/permease [Acidobacteria bacterium]|nr:ABC transporter ATP-binding protein/permease [Acidobacteriota bacterium]